jgi:hypothetical protein
MSDEFMEVVIEGIRSTRSLEGEQITTVWLYWICEKGFGNLEITQTIKGGEPFYHIESEMMGRDFAKRVLCTLVDKATFERGVEHE